ncbi:hypothetical protein SAMN00790413_05776 [Deinococcus hopiensis KR-140]|uniref:Uncharacterized protein n=1 Tax=Deinococcus hopiensis KR-140 TaxID=695939 RepID=A0A1W1UEB3_9DEIO|nr:hypothetical protein SAMN00790413_05776 [Deinococcus hopiensis KR-140]
MGAHRLVGMEPPYPRVVIRVERYDPEEVGTIQASTHPDTPEGAIVRAVYYQELEATGELDVYKLEIGSKGYKGEPDEQDSQWSRSCLVLRIVHLWPKQWDEDGETLLDRVGI